MRHVASFVVGIALTGCSLLYNPNNLPASIDAPAADADPSMLEVDGAGPAVLLEGQGTGGSRPAILAITGKNFVAPVTVRVFATGSERPMITLDDTPAVSSTNDVIVVAVTLPIDTVIPSKNIPLTIEVSQAGGGTVITKSLTGAVELHTLPELEGAVAITDSAMLQPMYSRVNVSAGITFTPASGKPRALIRSASTIVLGDVDVSANGNAAGPGGAAGGASGQPGDGGASGGHAGSATAGGAGGGFATVGGSAMATLSATPIPGGAPNGDPLISGYALTVNISAGGGGGSGTAGGSGGGTIELTAAGDVQVGAITANGGVGGPGGVTAGGGGAGGVVVIRSGGTATLGGAINTLGGAAGTGGVGSAGAGSIGRTRIDAPMIAGAQVPPSSYHRGVSFDPTTPLIFTKETQKAGIKLSGTVADRFDMVVLDSTGAPSTQPFIADFANATMLTVKPTLQAGFNRVCLTKSGVSVTVAEATNCIDIAYLP